MTKLISPYYDRSEIQQAVSEGLHREVIGGLWDEVGDLQLQLLKDKGLRPHHRLLDIGCGSLRLGVKAVRYLYKGNYWGTDISEALMLAGFENEIVPNGLDKKLSKSNLIVDEDFKFQQVPNDIDFAVAQSVFSHLPINHLKHCLQSLGKHVRGNCEFYVTAFIVPETKFSEPFIQSSAGVVTYPSSDPFHYTIVEITNAVEGSDWSFEYIGDWDHPRGQKLLLFYK